MRPPGMPKTGGRKKGVPNKINSMAKTAFLAVFRDFQDGGHLKRWILECGDGRPATGNKPEIAANPGKAVELLFRMAEYYFSKAPTEITGADGGPVVVDFGVDLSRKPE